MRMLLQASLPHEEFNAAIREGNVGEIINRIIQEAKPEAVYFTEYYGQRTVIMIINLEDPSQVPAFAEPWFLSFNADVEFHVVMSADDLAHAGLNDLGMKWG